MGRWGIASRAWVLLVGLGFAGVSSAQPGAPEGAASGGAESMGAGPVVQLIEVLADPELKSDFSALIEIEVGKPLSREVVSRTLTNFVAAGIATRVEVRQRPYRDGVAAQIVVFADTRVVETRLEGDLGLSKRRLERLVELVPGDLLVENRVLRSVYAMQDDLVGEGFLDAVVRVRVDLDATQRQATVVWDIAAGLRTLVAGITFQGDLGSWTPKRLLGLSPIGSGDPARARQIEQLDDRIEQELIEKGQPLARVELVQQRREGQGLQLELKVDVGPELVIAVEGAKLAEFQRRKLLPLDREPWDDTLVTEAEDVIRRDYQSRGFWRIQVSSEVTRSATTLRVVFRVVPGVVWAVREVQFEGNASVAAEVLRPLVGTTARRAFVPGSGRLIEAELEADRANLLSYYRLQGWLDAEVAVPRVEEVEEDHELVVTFPIVEGVRRRIVRVSIDGGEPCGLEPDLLHSRSGGPWHPLLIDESEAALRAACEAVGYADVLVDRNERWNEAHTLVDIDWEIDAGPRYTVDRILLRGERKSDPGFVLRAAGIEAGQPLSRAGLLAAERRLFRLGVFADVDVSVAPTPARNGRRDVIVTVREGRTNRVSYGIGYDSEDGLGALFGFSHSHLAGRGYQLQVDLRPSEATSRFRLIARRPEIGRRSPFGLAFTLFADEEVRPAYSIERQGGRFEANRTWSKLSAVVGFDYRREDTTDVASALARLTLDRRDDPLDPTRGGSTAVVLQQAFPLWGAREEFFKLFVQQTAHLPLGPLGVFAASARFGAIEPFSDTRPIPIAERLYAGGRTTHRAFGRDRLGIIGETLDQEGVPVGGNGLVLLNLDWRFPIVGDLGGIVFVDGGNVWSQWDQVSADSLRWGVGLGVRYRSPVGPLRLEVGWPLEHDPIEDTYVVSFSFGNAF